MTERTMEPPDVDGVLQALGTDDVAVATGATTIAWASLDGEQVVVKSATGRSRAVLRREAEALDRIEASGLVRKLEVRDSEWATALVLRHAGHSTLLHAADLPAGLLMRALVHTCEVVDGMHRSGWSHGAIQPDHVIIGPRGRVRLCSLGSARPITDGPGGVSRDVDGLLALVRHARSELGRRTGRHQRVDRRVGRLLERIDSGRAPERPAELASALRAVQERGPLTGRRGTVAISATAVLLVSAATALLWSPWPSPSNADATGSPSRVARPIAPVPNDRLATSTTSTLETTTTVDADTPVVMIDGVTYLVGLPGDVAVVGDWDCDGTSTARSLRSATGELFEFPDVPSATTDTEGAVIGVIDDAVDLRVEPLSGTAPPCDQTVAVMHDGTEVSVP